MQRQYEQPQHKAKGQTRYQLADQKRDHECAILQHWRKERADHRQDDQGKGEGNHQPNSLGYCFMSEGGKTDLRPTDSQKNREGHQKRILREIQEGGELFDHNGTIPTIEGRASMPISSKLKTGALIPFALRTVRRKRRRREEVMSAG